MYVTATVEQIKIGKMSIFNVQRSKRRQGSRHFLFKLDSLIPPEHTICVCALCLAMTACLSTATKDANRVRNRLKIRGILDIRLIGRGYLNVVCGRDFLAYLVVAAVIKKEHSVFQIGGGLFDSIHHKRDIL